jgi:hypothetical protein
MHPKARTEQIVVKELGDETLLYDTRGNKLHSLNRVAAFVWQNCDGNNSLEQIAQVIEEKLHLSANEASVALAVEQLSTRNLLAEKVKAATPAVKKHRREMLKVLTSALSIPVIASILAPEARAAASTTTTTTTTTTLPVPTPIP